MNDKRSFLILFYLACLVLTGERLTAQSIIRHPDVDQPLSNKWAWAVKEAADRMLTDGVWIGYGIRRWMGENSHMGSFNSADWRSRPSLHELLYGQKEFPEEEVEWEEAVRREARRALEGKKRTDEPKVVKGVAILLGYNTSSKNFSEPVKLIVSNLSLTVDLGDRPLVWLGNVPHDESVKHLEKVFGEVSVKFKEKLLFAISIHDSSQRAYAFMKKQLNEGETEKLRGSAAFWIGQADRQEDIPLLVETATDDRSKHVREQAVFGLSQMKSEKASLALIDLAKHGTTTEVRSKAIFWLGQSKDPRALEALAEMVRGK